MNPSNSKEGSYSCQCTVTLIEQHEETKTIVLRMFELLSMFEDSLEDIGAGFSKNIRERTILHCT